MHKALKYATAAYNKSEVPVGAVIVNEKQDILGIGYNQKENSKNPTHHAEILAIKDATHFLKEWRLEHCTIYVTLEPCLMCLGAIIQSRISRLVFGAYDPKGGVFSMGYRFHAHPKLNHKFDVLGGILEYECGKILSDFFKLRREHYK